MLRYENVYNIVIMSMTRKVVSLLHLFVTGIVVVIHLQFYMIQVQNDMLNLHEGDHRLINSSSVDDR